MEPEKGPEPKRRKIHKPPPRRTVSSPSSKTPKDAKSLPSSKIPKDAKSRSSLTVPGSQTSAISFRIQQAKTFAVARQNKMAALEILRNLILSMGIFCCQLFHHGQN